MSLRKLRIDLVVMEAILTEELDEKEQLVRRHCK